MSNALQRAINVAFSVFEKIQVTQEQLDQVVDAVNDINMHELDVKPDHLKYNSHVFSKIVDHAVLNFDIFYVKKGYTLPLHDHPGMTGIMKVLFGEMRVRSYTVINQAGLKRTGRTQVMRCKKSDDQIYTSQDRPAVLTSDQHNIHEIIAITDIAFFDCLAPPYDDNCTFYRYATGCDDSDKNTVELMSIGPEADYHTNPRRYSGVSFHVPNS